MGAHRLPGGTDPEVEVLVSGVTLDSRGVVPGDLYAALPGHVTHGARYVRAAVDAGALAVLTDAEGAGLCADAGVPVFVVDGPRQVLGAVAARLYGRPADGLQMLGITGTNGKTTVASMVESGLRAAGRTTGLIGTVGMRVAGEAYPGARTTPEATDLHAALAVMRERGVQSVVMEVSSIAVEEHRIDGVRYDVAAFTNLSQDHLDYHGTMEDYFAAKARLFVDDRAQLGIVGIDDEWGRLLADETRIPVQTWSLLDSHADWRAVREGGVVAVVGPDGERQPLRVPMPGSFNIANAVCAYAVLRAAGVTADAAAAGIAAVEVPGRMQLVGEGAASGGSSTTRIRPTPSSASSARRARSPRAGSSPCWARAAIGTAGSVPSWERRRRASPTSSSSPTTIPVQRIRAASACPSARGPTRWRRGDARRSTTWGTAARPLRLRWGWLRRETWCWFWARGTSRGRRPPAS